jgi:hypothetical protein
VLIAALAIGCVPLLLVLAGGVFAAVWFFRSSGPESSRVAEASASITSAEPARAEAVMQNNPDAIGEPKEGSRPGAPVPPNEAPRPGIPLQPNEAPRPGGPGEPKEAPRPEVRVEPPKEAPRPDDRAQPKEAPRAAAGPDVDALVKLLSQDVLVGSKEYRRPPDAEWISAVKQLRSSSDPAVAAAVTAMTAPEGTLTGRAFAITLAMKVRAESREKMRKLVESGHGNLTGILDKWADDEQLNEAVKAGFMTRSEADAYAVARNGGQADTNATWSTILGNAVQEKVVEDQVRAIRKRAEVLEGHVFVEHLVAASRARAGAKTEDAPLVLKVGLLPDRSRNFEELGLVCGSSKAARELTNLTLLLTVRGTVGSRYVAVFMPRLGPAESFRLLPFACGTRELRATAFKQPPAEAVERYSIWCDQFTLENQPLPEAATRDGIFAYAALAVLTNRALVADPSPSPFAFRNPNPLLNARFGITFTDIQPKGDGYQVKAQFARYDLADKSKIAESAILAGTLHKSPPSMDRSGAVLVPDAICDLQGRGNQLRFQITIPPSGELALVGQGFPFEGRNLVSEEEMKKSDAIRTQSGLGGGNEKVRCHDGGFPQAERPPLPGP